MSSHALFRIFPVPRMLSMEGGGIEISDASVRYFKFGLRGGERRILSFGEEPLSPGAIAEGTLCDPRAVQRALIEVRKHCGFSFVHASLPEQKGYLFDVAVPRGSAALVDEVRVALSDHVPLSPAEVVFDCEALKDHGASVSKTFVVTAFPEALASHYAEVFQASGFSPLSFELEPQAASRAMTLHGSGSHAQLLIEFGSARSVVSVVERGAVRFTTSAEGSSSIDQKLLKKVSASHKDPEDAAREVERLKFEEGLRPGSNALDACSGAASALAGAVRKVLVYWKSKGTGGERLPIDKAILYGENAPIEGLCDYLAGASGVPCELADLRSALLSHADVPPLARTQSYRFATVIGLALRGVSSSTL